MKIAIDASLLSSVHSGVEFSILGLITGLSKLPTDDTVLAYVGKRFQCPDLPAGCVKLRRASGGGRSRLRRILWQQTLLPMYLKAEKVDLFHGPGYVLPALSGVPSIVTVYDIIALLQPKLCKRSNVMHYKRMLPRSIRKAELVIVPSHTVARQIVEHLHTDEGKIRVIPCGIDARFKPASEDERRQLCRAWRLPERCILFVGNLEPKKNLTMLVRAFFAAKQNKGLPHKLVLAGMPGWKYGPVLKVIDALGLTGEVILPGYVSRDLLPVVYSAAEMFVFPSLIEGFGLPPLEAMACGTPVIISKDPALRETTGGAALEVEATDLRALREAIETLAEDEQLRRSLAEKGRTRAGQFSWTESAGKTLEVYHEAFERAKMKVRREDLMR